MSQLLTADQVVIRPIGIAARKGTRLICSNKGCRAHIATFKQNLMCGAPDVGADLFEFTDGQTRTAGDGATCKKCGAAFMRDERRASLPPGFIERVFHTPAGWIGYTFRQGRR